MCCLWVLLCCWYCWFLFLGAMIVIINDHQPSTINDQALGSTTARMDELGMVVELLCVVVF